MCFYISQSNLRLGIRSIPFSKWTMFSKILSLLRCHNDLYFQNDNQTKNVSFQRSPCRTFVAKRLFIILIKNSPLIFDNVSWLLRWCIYQTLTHICDRKNNDFQPDLDKNKELSRHDLNFVIHI